MSGVAYDYIEQYIRGLIPQHSEALRELEDYAKENSVPIVQKETAKFLELLVTVKKPENVLELGTAIGYSALLMNMTSGGKCNITTIERDENMVNIASENFKKYGVSDKIKIISGDCLDVLDKIQEKYDMIFLDAGKGHYNHFLPLCLKLLKQDGIIVADNVLFRGMVASEDLVIRRKITIVKRMKSYLEMVSGSDKLITSVIPMGDGIAVTTRRNDYDKA